MSARLKSNLPIPHRTIAVTATMPRFPPRATCEPADAGLYLTIKYGRYPSTPNPGTSCSVTSLLPARRSTLPRVQRHTKGSGP